MSGPVYHFRGEFEFLSNFYPSTVEYGGEDYPTVEHAFQAAKTLDLEKRREIQEAHTPGAAKKLGRKVELRRGWAVLRVAVMRDLLMKKFAKPVFMKKLLATGDRPLIEGNNWGDKFWGEVDGRGSNVLGRLLEDIRQSLR